MTSPYPTIEKPLPLADGSVVVLLTVALTANQRSGTRLDLFYRPVTPADDLAARRREAALVAGAMLAWARQRELLSATACPCDTRAQEELRERPSQRFAFTRDPDGEWREVDA